MATTSEPKCQTCGRSEDDHIREGFRHAFNNGSISVSETFSKRSRANGPGGSSAPPERRVPADRPIGQWPFDPVLRQALIDKGIITPEDLAAAQAKIQAITGVVTRGGENGSQ